MSEHKPAHEGPMPVDLVVDVRPDSDPSEHLANRENPKGGTVEGTEEAEGRKVGSGTARNGGTLLEPAEAGRRSGQARRARAAARAQTVQEAKLTTRQRLGVALSTTMSVKDWEDVIAALKRDAKAGDSKAIHALARMQDQAFGRAQVAQDEGAEDELAEWEAMTPAQRAATRAALLDSVRRDGQAAGIEADPREEDSEEGVNT